MYEIGMLIIYFSFTLIHSKLNIIQFNKRGIATNTQLEVNNKKISQKAFIQISRECDNDKWKRLINKFNVIEQKIQ